MSDESGLQRTEGSDEKTVYRPGPDGGLEEHPAETGDYREQLGSRRWDAAPLENTEVERTDPRIAVGFIVGLSVLTFVLLVVGYTNGFWG